MKDFQWGDESYLDVYDGLQSQIKHKYYNLNNMEGIIDIGKYRSYQEDSLLIMQKNDDVKLMALADGMGGLNNGDLASNYILLLLSTWFNNRNFNNKDLKSVLIELKELIVAGSNYINRTLFSGTTLVLALVLDDKTITINVGDSRIYIYDGNLKQISKDQSLAWDMLMENKIKEKDDIRYFKKNNILNFYIGYYFNFDINILNNNDYSKLFLFTDGVTDILSDKDLSKIILKNGDISNDIINMALTKEEHKKGLDNRLFFDSIVPGKDNASLIYYKR